MDEDLNIYRNRPNSLTKTKRANTSPSLNGFAGQGQAKPVPSSVKALDEHFPIAK